jgi:cell division protein FtsB
VTAVETVAPAEDPVEIARDRRLADMQREYADLEQERDALGEDIKVLHRNLAAAELPAETKRTLTQELGRISFYVGNPKMLGAFADADGIRAYLDEIKRARSRLEAMAADLEKPAPE